MALTTLAVLVALAVSACTLLGDDDDSGGGDVKLNPLEAAAEELLPPDATVLERTDSVCVYGRPQPSCEFIRYIRKGVPQALRVEDARRRIQDLGWTVVNETHSERPRKRGDVLFELSRGERFARWRLLPDDQNQECIDHTDPPISCADQISMY